MKMSGENIMLKWDPEGHHLFTDGNGNKVVLLYNFGLHRKADPVNALLAYRLPFSKDHIVVI